MLRRYVLAMVLTALAAPLAAAGGFLCMISSLESDLARDGYAAELRAKGPTGLDAALALYDTALSFQQDLEKGMAADPQFAGAEFHPQAVQVTERARQFVDEVAGQRGAWQSRLYWYADLEQAKAAAAESGKPILSLRMLGKFFRTALYTNAEISAYLRDNFVLHWQSVRPVPVVTIDFGDGRKLERTLTGNSAHMLLDASGRPLDVLPGLYGPQAFRQWLGESSALARRWAEWGGDAKLAEFSLMKYHAEKWQAVDAGLREDLAAIAPELASQGDAATYTSFAKFAPQAAVAAGARAFAKGKVEAPLLVAALPEAGLPAAAVLDAHAPDFWAQVGAAHADMAELDAASIDTMRRENPTAFAAGERSPTKYRVEDPILQLVRSFQQSMAVDTMRNEYTLHQTVRRWFAEGGAGADPDALTERVYAELFLTPSSDPWLGLAPEDVYTALDQGGLTAGP
jgi:hypothetical protein